MNRTLAVRTAAVATLAGLGLGLAPAAHAETVGLTDPADVTPGSLNDIRQVAAGHLAKRLVVRVGVTDLKATSEGGPASMALFVDTDASKAGPEFRLGTGLYAGTDYQLVRMRNWKAKGDPLTCGHGVDLERQKDLVRFKIRRGCLGSPAELRVGVKMVDHYDGSHPITDWLKGPRKFTRWLSQG